MTNDQIEHFLGPAHIGKSAVLISFKGRESVTGIFIQTRDYAELKSKNLWRIVSQSRIAEYKGSRNEDLARIFNGTEFTRLSLV